MSENVSWGVDAVNPRKISYCTVISSGSVFFICKYRMVLHGYHLHALVTQLVRWLLMINFIVKFR